LIALETFFGLAGVLQLWDAPQSGSYPRKVCDADVELLKCIPKIKLFCGSKLGFAAVVIDANEPER
jgi:hypothetical protein